MTLPDELTARLQRLVGVGDDAQPVLLYKAVQNKRDEHFVELVPIGQRLVNPSLVEGYVGPVAEARLGLLQQRADGKAVFLISEDLDEVLALSDRIAVIYEGQIIGVVNREEATIEQLGLMMAGVSKHEALGTGAPGAGEQPAHVAAAD